MRPEAIERKARKARKVTTIFSAGFAGFAFPVGLAVIFLALHLPYLPSSLEDLDSINFALGVRHFDVARHQPHPPGYPVFIVAAKAVHAVVPSEGTALSVVSVVAGTLGVLAMAALFGRMERADAPIVWPLAATAVAMTAPMYWFTAARPLSDVAGLAAAIAVQALTLSAASVPALAVAGFAAGVATGFRSQVAWLTVPLLALRGLGAGDWGLWRGSEPQAPSPKPLLPALLAFVAGVLVWFVPLVVVSGGPVAYWQALSDQGAEDLGNIQMLWTGHSARAIAGALYYAFVSPWAAWPMAVVVLVLAALGAVRAVRRAPHALAWLAVGFGPYLVFDLLFQETFTSRYALPLVIPMAYLAVCGTRWLPGRLGLAVAVPLAMFGAHVGGTSIAAYSRQKAPAFRLLDDMRRVASSTREPPVLAMDRREDLDFRRPLSWAGDAVPAVARLAAPPQHEWLEPVKYWNGGGRAPVWFVVDPMRTSIDLVQHGRPAEYRWSLPYPVLVSGVRPNEMDWYQIDRPEWYVGEGWALTPESAGVAGADHRGLSTGAISGWVARSATSGGALMIGGRNFDPTLGSRFTVMLDRRTVLDDTVTPGAFIRLVQLPVARDDTAAGDYGPITVATDVGARVAVEQFDASSRRPLVGFGDGWQEPELNPATGMRWRWLSERGELRVRSPAPRVTLHLEGESPRTYFSRASHLVVRSGGRVVFDESLSADFSVNIPIVNADRTLVLETDQVFVPADRSRSSADRRHLGLRIFKCELY